MINPPVEPELASRLGALFSTLPNGHVSLFEREFRTPLNALVTSAAVLAEDMDALTPEQARERVSALRRRALFLHMVAEDLFCAAAIAEGRLELHLQEIGLREILAEASTAALPLLQHRGQWMVKAAEAAPALVRIDARRIGQVLLTLIHAASEEAVDESALALGIEVQRRIVRVEVSALQLRAVVPAPRAPRLPAEPTESINLGMGVARTIVEAHGGVFDAQDGVPYWLELPRP
jgi:two-component system sensor histidine kinase KdpD